MPNRDKDSGTMFGFPPAPPLNDDVSSGKLFHANQHPGLSRRSFLKLAGTATVGLVAAKKLYAADQLLAYLEWPPDSTEFLMAYGNESIPLAGEEWVVFGGFGQKYSVNAAQELFNAIGREQAVSSIKYQNQGFTIDELAQSFERHIAQRKMESLNIVGVSMGLPTAIMALHKVIERHEQGLGPISKMPSINYLAAYSSPADWQDAMDGNMATVIASVSDKLQIPPAVIAKFLYSSFDGDGDPQRALNFLSPIQLRDHIFDSIRQTFNGTPPRLVLSQIQIISEFNLIREQEGIKKLLVPGKTKFIYCMPTNNIDTTVNNKGAIEKYSSQLAIYNISTTVLETGPVGHANTYASAAAMGKFISWDRAVIL